MAERRRFIRWEIDRQAKITLPDQEASVDCQIKDINFKGAQISLGGYLEKDAYIALSINLSSDCTLNVEAWVVWHKTIIQTNNYGLYFTRIKDLDKEKIYQFIRKYFPEEINRQWWKDLTRWKGGEQMEDRRIFERIPAEFPLRYLEPRSGKDGRGHTQNISAKGIGLVTKEELTPQTPLEMWIEIPDKGEPIYTRGEVVWSKMLEPDKYRIGTNLEKADLMGLSRVLRAI